MDPPHGVRPNEHHDVRLRAVKRGLDDRAPASFGLPRRKQRERAILHERTHRRIEQLRRKRHQTREACGASQFAHGVDRILIRRNPDTHRNDSTGVDSREELRYWMQTSVGSAHHAQAGAVVGRAACRALRHWQTSDGVRHNAWSAVPRTDLQLVVRDRRATMALEKSNHVHPSRCGGTRCTMPSRLDRPGFETLGLANHAIVDERRQ